MTSADCLGAHDDSALVQRYVPEFEKRWNRYADRFNGSCDVTRPISKVKGRGPISIERSINTDTVDFPAERTTACGRAKLFPQAMNTTERLAVINSGRVGRFHERPGN